MSAKRRKAHRRKLAVVSAVALAVLVLVIVLICKGCAGGKKGLSVWGLGITANTQSMRLTAKATDVCVLIKPITMNLHTT